MNGQSLQDLLHRIQKQKWHPGFVLLSAICLIGVVAGSANALYILTDTEKDAVVLEESAQIQDVSSQLVYQTTSSTGYDVTLGPGKPVTLTRKGETLSARSQRETISELLHRMHVDLEPNEMVGVDLSNNTVLLTIDQEITYHEQVSEPASYETVRVANPNLLKGVERVKQEGVNGEHISLYEVVWSKGKLISREFAQDLGSTAVDEIIEYGTASPAPKNAALPVAGVGKSGSGGVLTLADGTTLSFSGSKQMTATAYTSGHDGVGQITATGTRVKRGSVAVDPRVIPLGTRMYIVTNDGMAYGPAVAEDTGTRGNLIDLYHDTYDQCIQFGRRGCTVYFLK